MANNTRKKRKGSSRRRKNSKLNKVLTVIFVIAVLALLLYQNVPQVRAFADPKIEKAKIAVETVLPGFFSDGSEAAENAPSSAVPPDATPPAENLPASSSEVPPDAASDAPSSAEPLPGAFGSGGGFTVLSKNLAMPVCAGSVHKIEDHEIRTYAHYSLCYRESYEQAEWSAYCLTAENLIKNASRSDDFRSDPAISTGSATPEDYKKTGYDRGHLSPAADFAFDKNAMSETFYMTNMSPQTGGFNRGIWKDLESTVREWAKKFGRVYVVSGPVLEKNAGDYKSIGNNAVSVPEFYYKVILAPLYEDDSDRNTPEDAKAVAAIGFILPNQKCTDSFFNYAMSIDQVEKRTGLDFFSELDDPAEEAAEAAFDLSVWE